MTLSKEDIPNIINQFLEWFNSEPGQKHFENIEREKLELKELMEQLSSMNKEGNEFTDLVLYGLLPYTKTKFAKRVSTFGVFMNVKLFLKDYNYTEKDWNILANMIYDLTRKFQESPDKLDKWIREFTSDKIHSRMFQCGSISPILFCINDSHPVVNNRVIHTYNDFATLYGWDDVMSQKLEYYPDNVKKCKKLVSELNVLELNNLTAFDEFCYWYDRIYKESVEKDEEEEIDSEGEERIRIDEVNFPHFIESVSLDNVAKYEPHSLRNPERIKVNQIITNVSQGRWVLPKFQRYFDWRKKHVKEFLKSIFNDYYVGALLVWDVDRDADSDLQLGIMPIRGVNINTDEVRKDSIILDGQQRITSLYYAIRAPNFSLKGSDEPSYFYINFLNFFNKSNLDDIIVVLDVKLSTEESFRKMLFPFYELENNDDWVSGFEDFLLKNAVNSRDKIIKIRRIIDKKLSHIHEGFEIPYISLPASMPLAQVTDIFEKINTMGKPLNVFDLLIARLSIHEIELKKLWEGSIKRYPKLLDYFKSIDKIPIYILQAISLCYDKNSSCKREDILNIFKNIFQQTDPSLEEALSFEEAWHEMDEYMSKAISKLENMRDGFGVKDKRELPFAPMIPILAALLREIDQSKSKADCYNRLNMWYWASVFSNAYSGAVDTQLTNDFKEMRDWFSNEEKISKTVDRARKEFGTWGLKEIHTKSNAMYRGVLSLLALEGARDFDTGQTLENARANDKDHIFPKSGFGSVKHINSILNMTWMSDDTNRKIKKYKKPSVYVKEFIRDKYGNDEKKFLEVLKSHFINRNAYDCMLKDDFDGFIAEREKTIIAQISDLIGLEGPPQYPSMISPETPFSNKMAYLNMIKSCEGHIYWVDKYFSGKGLEYLTQAVDGKKVKKIRILVSVEKADERLRDLFKDFRDEMRHKKVSSKLRVIIDSKLKSSIHDRWVLSKSNCFNIPSPDVVARDQYSEIKSTENKPPFRTWWNKALDIIRDWDEIQKSRK